MKTSSASLVALLAVLHPILLIACGTSVANTFSAGGFTYTEDGFTEWKLPDSLRELSGFATDADDRLFAHNDETAVIHEIDYAKGGIIKSFALGNPPLAGDFEGITTIEGRFALTTSNGDLYLAAEGAAGEHVTYEVIRTGLGKRCEVEGIEYVATDRLLYFACKRVREPGPEGRFTLIAWSLETRSELADRSIRVDQAAFAGLPGKGPLRPSGIAISRKDGSLVVTAARHRALVTLTPTGEMVGALRVPDSKSLPQIEAIAFATGGTLMLGSEGGKDRGRMRVYQPAN